MPFGVDPHPTFVQLGERGPGADRLGRTLALLGDLPTELGPHGWRLAAHGGVDLRRAQSFLAQDLEALSIAGAGYSGALSVHLVGPWTLAAQVYLAHKDKIVSDPGAVRERDDVRRRDGTRRRDDDDFAHREATTTSSRVPAAEAFAAGRPCPRAR